MHVTEAAALTLATVFGTVSPSRACVAERTHLIVGTQIQRELEENRADLQQLTIDGRSLFYQTDAHACPIVELMSCHNQRQEQRTYIS
ncbi:hypothetical protein [Shimazuella alba]|uniref:Uncharacterized protein n=1 Tax=Shimazuella alba TaxID=2690964 RepID=A0A6I4VTG7_9BACL|nr:hypothetical protein [Shimazuella alba]MXQ53156.1 hypothetical protein [Shimazuella alba]